MVNIKSKVDRHKPVYYIYCNHFKNGYDKWWHVVWCYIKDTKEENGKTLYSVSNNKPWMEEGKTIFATRKAAEAEKVRRNKRIRLSDKLHDSIEAWEKD